MDGSDVRVGGSDGGSCTSMLTMLLMHHVVFFTLCLAHAIHSLTSLLVDGAGLLEEDDVL